MKKATIAASILLVLSSQPAEASFLKKLIREGAAQLRETGRQKAQSAVQSAIGAIEEAGSKAANPSADERVGARPATQPSQQSDSRVTPVPEPGREPSCCRL